MRLSPTSFALGVVVAAVAPMLSRVFRPVAVETAAAGLAIVADARRIAAERIETLEDILAEARARRHEEPGAPEPPVTASRPRRRTNSGTRQRAS
jgi:hypothetical protein